MWAAIVEVWVFTLGLLNKENTIIRTNSSHFPSIHNTPSQTRASEETSRNLTYKTTFPHFLPIWKTKPKIETWELERKVRVLRRR